MDIKELKQYIDEHIKTNGKGEITADVLADILNKIINPETTCLTIPNSRITARSGSMLENCYIDEAAETLGISEEEVESLFAGQYNSVYIPAPEGGLAIYAIQSGKFIGENFDIDGQKSTCIYYQAGFFDGYWQAEFMKTEYEDTEENPEPTYSLYVGVL